MEPEPGIDELLAAAIGGDKEAENQLFSKLHASIFELVQQRIWNIQKHASEIQQDAEDLTGDICGIILQKYKTATFHNGFMPWVFQIVRYKVGEYYRQRDRKPRVEAVDVADDNLQFAVDPTETEQRVELQELNSMISRALRKMDRRCRTIMRALLQGEIKAYIDEQRQRNTPIGSIYAHIHRCRKRFVKLLFEEGYE